MIKIYFFALGFLLLTVFLENTEAGGECPDTSHVYSCSPKCIADTDCSNGRKCCPNQCNTKSCAEPKTIGSSSGGKYSSSGGSGTYCENVKCNSYEKCELDRNSKKKKCVRA